jgi:hypothetical protein
MDIAGYARPTGPRGDVSTLGIYARHTAKLPSIFRINAEK